MRNKNLQSIYRLLILSVIALVFGCQAPPDDNNNVIKPPEWIYQKEFKEFPNDDYIVEVGVSNRSFDDARSRALNEIKRQILPKLEFLYVGTPHQKQVITELASLVRDRIDEYKKNYEGNENSFRSSLIIDYSDIFNNVKLENTLAEAQLNEYRSWAELFAASRKKYTDGFTYYTLMTFLRTFMLDNQTPYLIDVTNDDKNLDAMRANHSEMNFDKFLKTFYKMIDLYQYLTFQINSKETLKEEIRAIHSELKGLIDKNILALYSDLEVRFSDNNVKAWKGKYTEKIDIQIYWKKTLIKIPLKFKTSGNAKVELVESVKDDVSYELRVMPLFELSKINKSGQYSIEFEIKPEGLRFSKLINLALKKKFQFTLPTEENSYFTVEVYSENLKISNKIQKGFADNISKSLQSNLEFWCENNDYKLGTSFKFWQTQKNQNTYLFRILVGLENLSIIENKEKKYLKSEVLLNLFLYDDTVNSSGMVRLKQDRFIHSSEITNIDVTPKASIFDVYCAGMVVNVDFQKVLSELIEKAFK